MALTKLSGSQIETPVDISAVNLTGVTTASDLHITGVATVAPVSIGNSGITIGQYTDAYGDIIYGIGIGTNTWSGVSANHRNELYIRRSQLDGGGGILIESGLSENTGADSIITMRSINKESNSAIILHSQVGTANTVSVELYAGRYTNDGGRVRDSAGIVVREKKNFNVSLGSTVRVHLNSTGAIGIGTTNPSQTFSSSIHLNGSLTLGRFTTGTINAGIGTTVGTIVYNESTGSLNVYAGVGNTVAWKPLVTEIYLADVMIAAGGGGGGYVNGGGGGGGGIPNSYTVTIQSNASYTIIVGAGGAGSSGTNTGFAGNNSSISGATVAGLTAIGGGAGDSGVAVASTISGGSGGGGRGEAGTAGGSGTTGQGSSGGNGIVFPRVSGGGGGRGQAGFAGDDPSSTAGGVGGEGTNDFSAWGSATSSGHLSGGIYYFGGGGGGGCESVSRQASGGLGGGGAAGASSGGNGVNGTANTAGGGGGGSRGSFGSGLYNGGNGGSGIVILRYLGPQRGNGGTVYSSGGYTYHKFTSSSTYTG